MTELTKTHLNSMGYESCLDLYRHVVSARPDLNPHEEIQIIHKKLTKEEYPIISRVKFWEIATQAMQEVYLSLPKKYKVAEAERFCIVGIVSRETSESLNETFKNLYKIAL